MKYINANAILPDMLVEELQKYVQAGYIYIPAKDEQHKSWGELSGYRKELYERNEIIIKKHQSGVSIEELAEEYYLSVYAIRKIIYQKWLRGVAERQLLFSTDCICIVWCIENSLAVAYNYDIALLTGGLQKCLTLKFYIHGQAIHRLFT